MVLSEDDVKDIIKRKKKGETYDSIAIDYGVSMSTIVRAVNPGYSPAVLDHYLAIDQGPQAVMIENYRSGLLWNLFMQAPEIQSGLKKLGFYYDK